MNFFQVREKSGNFNFSQGNLEKVGKVGEFENFQKSQGILIWIMSGNPVKTMCAVITLYAFLVTVYGYIKKRKDSLFSHFHNFFQSL